MKRRHGGVVLTPLAASPVAVARENVLVTQDLLGVGTRAGVVVHGLALASVDIGVKSLDAAGHRRQVGSRTTATLIHTLFVGARRIKNPVRPQLDSVGHEEAEDGVAPHEGDIAPRQGRHEDAKTGNESGHRLGTDHGEQQDASGSDGPEGPARARHEYRQVTRDRQHQVHQRLQMCVVEVEPLVPEIEEAEGRRGTNDAQHSGHPQDDAHVPGLGLITVVHPVIGDGQDGAIIQQRQ